MTFQHFHTYWINFFDADIITSLLFIVFGIEMSLTMTPRIQTSASNWKLFKSVVSNSYRRLLTLLTAVIFLYSTVLNRLFMAPLWNYYTNVERANCRANWRLNLLTFNNYGDQKEMCIEQSWILSALHHMIVGGFVILLLLFKFPRWNKFIIGSLLTISFAVVSTFMYIYKLDPVSVVTPEWEQNLSGNFR